MISGTSKISLILGPINGHIWARGPRIYGFSYTTILQKILESIWEHLGNILFSVSENRNFRKFKHKIADTKEEGNHPTLISRK